MDCPPATPRLHFRTWTADDLPLALAIWGDPEVTARVGGPFDEDHVRGRLADERAMQAERGFSYWPVFDRADGAHVGCCGLKPGPAVGEGTTNDLVEVGYYLRPSWWGRKLAAEAAAAAVRFAFERLPVVAVVAGHHPENHASGRVLIGLGFRFTHRALYPPTGLLHPNYRLDRP